MRVTQDTHSPMRRSIRPAIGALWAGALALQLGCYSYLPVQSAPPAQPQREVGIVVNDRGRVLLGERVGASVDRIDGRIMKRENGTLTVAVFRVTDIRGNSATWTGEQITIPEEAVLGYRPKAVSKIKTALLAGVLVLGVVMSLGTSFDIFGTPSDERAGPGGPQQS